MRTTVAKKIRWWAKALCVAAFFSLTNLPVVFAQTPAGTIPSFNFKTFDGTDFSDKKLVTGKPLFFIFFDTDCDHCRRAMEYVEKNFTAFNKAALYLITLDQEDKLKPFFRQYAPTLSGRNNVMLLQDTRNEFISKFRPKKYPSLFLYSAKRDLILYDDEEKSLPKFAEQVKLNAK